MSRTTMMTNILPHDLVVDILSRLPVKSLLRFRCVSKPWNSFINDSSFIKMHLNYSINNLINQHILITNFGITNLYFIPDNNINSTTESSLANDEIVEIDFPLKTPTNCAVILGSCNGLLLIHVLHEDIFCIWNPSTKEFKKLPHNPIEYLKNHWDEYRVDIVYGFGYDKINDDYKVVRIVRFEDLSTEVKVYTLGSNSWRRIQDMPDYLTLAWVRSPGIFVNGALHWVTRRADTYYDQNDEGEQQIEFIILALNIENETYEEIQHPINSDHLSALDVDVLGGCLCIFCDYKVLDNEMLVMKEYGVKESWTKLFPNNDQSGYRYLKPIKLNKNGEIFLAKDLTDLFLYDPKRGTEKQILQVKDEGEDTLLLVSDPKRGTTKSLRVEGIQNWLHTCIHVYVESLISLNSGTFVGKEQGGMLENNVDSNSFSSHR